MNLIYIKTMHEFNYTNNSCIVNVNFAYANQKVHEVMLLQCTMSMNFLNGFCK